MDLKNSLKGFDFFLFTLVVGISLFGIILIGSATQINISGKISGEMTSQLIFFVIGIIGMLIIAFMDYNFILRFYWLSYAVNALLLILVFVIGTEDAYGVSRWIRFGPVGIQPSEFTKIFMIVFLAKYLENNESVISTPLFLIKFAGIVLFPITLIAMQPSLSACLVPLMLSAILIFEGGLEKRIVVTLLIITSIIGTIVIVDSLLADPIIIDKILQPYQIERIRSMFLRGESGTNYYQTGYSVKAIASGQLVGKGLFHGTANQLNFLAESHTDFIFAVLGEEFGFIGAVGTIIIYLLIIFRCYYIGSTSPNLSGKLVCIGVGSMIFIHMFINIGVNVGIVPNTGMTLPFISAGGSSLLMMMASIGLVLSVGMNKNKKTMF